MNRHLHIVCLDVPWPADYGGAIDMLCRIQALSQEGIKIHLHYFSYNDRGHPDALNQFCESIQVYERKKGLKGFSFRLPYIVYSRINNTLTENLNKDEYPVLLEGIHCTGIIPALNKNKKIMVRLHNDECAYYSNLEKTTKHLLKKNYFNLESRLLKKYQRNLDPHCYYACITEKDTATFKSQYGLKNTLFIPAFIPYKEVTSLEGLGNFCLYHGNLSVPENEKAAIWLLKNVFALLKTPFAIAGKNPSARLQKLIKFYPHTTLVANPSDEAINELVKEAHINVLPSFNATGIKIKLLHALFEGRHCVVNPEMVTGTGLEAACHIGINGQAMAAIIMQLNHQPFTAEEIILRKELLLRNYNNIKNARQLMQCLW